eukprot:TRINITY_DN14100_c0_g1_i1.p1 TRINITY_DN14100_c0_g1~~TRINITY_DN14100_c0_g1_i1.p1  ORF type:complete len:430 (+),score=54.54 TRINITY_DN14100_c0_g1_i1:247-1536(+)
MTVSLQYIVVLILAIALVIICYRRFLSGAVVKTSSPGLICHVGANFWEISTFPLLCSLGANDASFSSYVLPALCKDLSRSDQRRFKPLFTFLSRQVLSLEAESHRAMHRLLARYFTSPKMETHRQFLTSTVQRLLEEAQRFQETHGHFDYVEHFAQQLPMLTILHIMGLPELDWRKFKYWTDVIEEWFGGSGTLKLRSQRAADAVNEFLAYMVPVLEQYKKRPEGNLISALMSQTEEGLLPEELLAPNILFLIAAGYQTTAGLLSGGMLALLENPDQLDKLRHDVDGLIGPTVQELLRYVSPVKWLYRQVVRDVNLGTQTLGTGEWVHFDVTRANRDALVFAQPERLNITRDNAARHVGFGVGAHNCLGRQLAILEAQISIAGMLRCTVELRLSSAESVKRKPLLTLGALHTLPLVAHWRPADTAAIPI